MTYNRSPGEPIAIVGTGCRFPGGASSPSKLWELLEEPCDLSKEVPEHRFKIAGFYHPDGEHHGTTNAPKSYWIEQDHRVFDASFFNITPKEAEAIDPQQKMLLEVVYEAMESAGIPIQDFAGKKVSCFIGSMTADFDGLTQKDEQTSSQYCATGTSRAIISNRISYFFDWKGPSMTIDTACSSSLVAIHQAVLGLRDGEAEAACVGGANVMLSPENFIAEASLHMLSPTGKSRMWDTNADGYARGEGVAAVILKTLSKALADGDEIEGIIRDSGVNSDGRSKGITMPSSELQAELIHDTYQKSGLNPRDPLDMPQYFEAHGTGTQAGDPREAGAICRSFFGDPESGDEDSTDAPDLIVGSIKTVIGHTEGAAGLAGLIKAILSMKHQLIPPNQHLETLNPSVAPFCKHLKIPKVITAWPNPAPGRPCRASVNSFGFGGTNAHAILERYEPSIHDPCVGRQKEAQIQVTDRPSIALPLMLSAASDKSLFKVVEDCSAFLKRKSDINLFNLSWTLAYRRSRLPQKIAFTGLTQDDIVAKMDKQLKHVSESSDGAIGSRTKTSPRSARILGVFTGQGAQWPSMSRELLTSSPSFRDTIRELQKVLDGCPDPPSWSIEDELMASPSDSRLNQAAFSQPLCTAVQVALVDVLKASGVTFYGVVGHSSGEIAAAYVAGRLSAKAAILIAYYRGFHAKLASGPNGSAGGMMAAGMDVEEAIDFCNQPNLKARLYVAASNAPASVTLSGDKEAIEEAKADLDNRQKFARMLMVDTAYHSHHMESCGKPYMDSLKGCQIHAQQSNEICSWVSSVYGPAGIPSSDELAGRYWRENMVQAVLFNEALERILTERGPFDAAIEVGPHAALKGPVTQTMKSILGSAIPYHGTLDRTKHDVLALGDCISFLWQLPIAASVDLKGYASNFSDKVHQSPQVVKGLPTYSWDHSQSHYRESRLVKQYLGKNDLPHELLGVRTSDDSTQELRWRNILKPSAIAWLKDHKFQGRIIVPAAAYCIMALEAARHLAGSQPTQMVELQGLEIFNAISAEEDSQGIETIFSLFTTSTDTEVIEASFILSSTAVDGNLPLRKAVSGRVSIALGNPHSSLLPQRPKDKPEMNAVDLEAFYASMQDIGLGYTGPFRALTSLQRRMNASVATLNKPHPEDPCKLRVRPPLLDVCFQAAFAAFAAPGDGALWTAFLPQKIQRLRFNLALCDVSPGKSSQLDIDAYITEFCPTTSQSKASFSGDIEIFNEQGQMEIQIEGINVASFASNTEADDRELYLQTVWGRDSFCGFTAVEDADTPVDHEFIDSCQRMARFYLSNAHHHSPRDRAWSPREKSLRGLDGTFSCSAVKNFDTYENIERLIKKSSNQALLNCIRVCGEHMPSLIPGMIDYAIQEASLLSKLNHQLDSVIKQISHRYPRLKILEIGSDDVTTTSILRSFGSAFTSYTVARVGGQLSDHVLNIGKESQSKVIRSEFDIHQDALDQGYIEQSYDLVIAAFTLRKAGSLEDALKSIRGLVRPGGYFIVLDSTVESFRQKFLRCITSIPIEPDNPPIKWNTALAAAGFGQPQTFQQNSGRLSLTVCQATDQHTGWLLRPLDITHHDSFSGDVLIVGGKTSAVEAIRQHLLESLSHWNGQITATDSFEEIDPKIFDTLRSAVILADLDESIVATMSPRKLKALQKIFSPNRQVLWLVSGFRQDNPYHNASVGIGRCIKAETPNLDLQFLDLDVIEGSGLLVSETFLRLALAKSADEQSQLWTTEHEIVVQNSKFLIPRILPVEALNDRLNSIRRVVAREVSTVDNIVEIMAAAETIEGTLHKVTRLGSIDRAALPNDQVEVQLDYSSLLAVKAGLSRHLYVCLGHNTSSGKRVIALSPTNSSFIRIPAVSAYPLDCEIGNEAAFLALVVSYLVCQSMPVPDEPGSIILYEPDEFVAFALKSFLPMGQRLLFFASDPGRSEARLDWTYINPRMSSRQVKSLIPADVSCIVDFSPKENTKASVLSDLVPPGTRHFPRSSFFKTDTRGPSNNITLGMKALKEAVFRSKNALRSRPPSPDQVIVSPVRRIIESGHQSLLTIVKWNEGLVVPEVQQQVKPSTVFSNSGTYLLVGLTGELGQSLSQLMVQSGVRYLVVVSRNPNKQPKWRDWLEAMGAKVLIEAVDAANFADVVRLRDSLARTMPPVSGIVNGAMVLSDGLFADMSLDSFQKVLRPKVEGSLNLDRAFSSVNLDFFIMFSSLTAVAGNRGQGNYAAANMFMAGLAAQRRKRGVAGSVLDIGMLYGIGYINRTEGAEIYANLRKQGYRPISEQDIHHMFIETIIAGRPGSGTDPELTTGLQRFSLADKQPLHWHFNPKFSHHTVDDGSISKADLGASTVSVRAQLRQASSAEEAGTTLRHCFATQLETMLQLPEGGLKRDVPIIELGVDSLVAVEIRSWFIKEVDKDMPVLKVLGGSTLAELCDDLAPEIFADNVKAVDTAAELASESAEASLGTKTTSTESGTANTPLTVYSDDDFDDENELAELTDRLYQTIAKMSYGQARLWFPYVYLEDKTAYNTTTSYKLKGLLDVSRFESAIQSVIKRHQVLRMSFFTDTSSGHSIQAVSSDSSFALEKISPADEDKDVRRETAKIEQHHYDLEMGDVFIATLLSHGPELHTIIFGYHHIILDAVSWQFFLQDLEKFYSTEDPKLGPASRFTDFAIKQRRLMESGGAQDKRQYWRSEFADLPPTLPLFPFSKVSTRKNQTRYDIRECFVLLDPSLVATVKQASTAAKTTTFHFYLSVLQVLLYKLLDITDLCIGITDANRTDPAFMQTIGFLLDSLPLRFKSSGDEPFIDRLHNTRSKVYAALGNSGVPLDVILEDLNVAASSETLPLFQILVNYRMGALKQKSMGGVQLEYLAYKDAKHPFDFILSIDEDEGAGGLTLSMQEYLYDQAGGDLIIQTYVHLLEIFSTNVSQEIGKVPLFHERQREPALTLGNRPRKIHDWPATLSLRVDSIIESSPESIAIKDSASSLTYHEMAERTDAIALELYANGGDSGRHIAVCFEPCADLICSLLAILRLGAVYIPLDIRNSDERLSTIIEESGAELVVTHESAEKRVSNFDLRNAKIVNVSNPNSDTSVTKGVPNRSNPESPAFIMFTSGSTGKPKGIVLTNANMLTHVHAATERMGIERERVLQQSAYGYDASLAQIFYALANGGTLIMSTNRQEMSNIATLMAEEKITFTLCAPSEYTVLFKYGGSALARCDSWRIAMCGGEAFPSHLKARFSDLAMAELKVFNAYGPTEIAVASNVGLVDYKESDQHDMKVSIGQSMCNYASYILDNNHELAPLGWPGEISIAGPAVASGYLENEALTKSKFIANNVSLVSNDSEWNTVYCTGDKGRMLPDGSIEYLGRIDGDTQIKLRGIRIEPDDIANTIIRCSQKAIVNAAVIIRDEDQILIAYVVLDQSKASNDPVTYLKQLLLDLPVPMYMRPAIIIPLEELPMGASGKLDVRLLKALPLPQIHDSSSDSTELTETENKMKEIWEEVLPHAGLAISKSSNFFSVGGNSLLLLALQAEIRKVFGQNVPLSELFQTNTLEALALKIRIGEGNISSLAVPVSAPEINWTAETSISSALISSMHSARASRFSKRPLTVVLTGATGFLGRSLLQVLEANKNVFHVHCLATRQTHANVSRIMANESPKITYHMGDLSFPRLGLPEEEARLVFADADIVIHNGADVSFMKTYDSLRRPNVEATKELVTAVADRQIPFHYVSTAGIAHLSGEDSFDEVSARSFPPPTDGSDGYVASKWASERYLENANAELGLPVWIHRPSSITGEGAPPMDIMQNVLEFSRNMRAVPNLDGWQGHFDFVDVSTVAKGIVSSVISNRPRPITGTKGVEYIHASGERVVPVKEVKTFLEKETRTKIRVLDMKVWAAEARGEGMEELVTMYLATVADRGEKVHLPRLKTKWSHV